MKFYKSIKAMTKHYDYVKEIGDRVLVSLEHVPDDMKDILYEIMQQYPCCIFTNIDNHIYAETDYKYLHFDIYLKKKMINSVATWKRCYTYIEIMGYTVSTCERRSRFDNFTTTKVEMFGEKLPFEKVEINI